MSYLKKLLIPNEKIVHLARRSVIVTFGYFIALEAVLILVALGVSIWAQRTRSPYAAGIWGTFLVLILIPIPFALWRYIWWRNKVYVVTSIRVLKAEGLFSKSLRDASLDKINDMVLDQSLLGRLLGFGDLQILTANEASGVTYHWLHNPVEFKRQAMQSREQLPGAGGTETGARDYQPSSDPLVQLERLGELRKQNVISDEEFQAKKAELMKKIR